MAWDDKKRAEVIAAYKDANPTPQNSAEIVKELAEKFEESPNGVRMILTRAGVYVTKDATAPAATGKTSTTGEAKQPRVSKEAQHAALKEQLERVGASVDNDIIDKMTGKAAAYFVEILKKLN